MICPKTESRESISSGLGISRTTVIFPSSTSGRHVKALPHPSQFKAKQKCLPALRGATQAPRMYGGLPRSG